MTVTLWAYWTGRELKEFEAMFDRLHELEPWITVDVSGGIDDTKIKAAMRSGSPPDVAVSSDMNNIPNFCSSGAWQDLQPQIDADGVDMAQFPPSAVEFTQYGGVQCAMPFTADSYGLYYNTDMFEQAGITSPPTTWSEMTADVKKLTVFNPDGSIKVAGFVPWMGYYETGPVTLGVPAGASWYDADGAVVARLRSPLAGAARVAEEPHRLLRHRQPAAVRGRRRATSSPPRRTSSRAGWP